MRGDALLMFRELVISRTLTLQPHSKYHSLWVALIGVNACLNGPTFRYRVLAANLSDAICHAKSETLAQNCPAFGPF